MDAKKDSLIAISVLALAFGIYAKAGYEITVIFLLAGILWALILERTDKKPKE